MSIYVRLFVLAQVCKYISCCGCWWWTLCLSCGAGCGRERGGLTMQAPGTTAMQERESASIWTVRKGKIVTQAMAASRSIYVHAGDSLCRLVSMVKTASSGNPVHYRSYPPQSPRRQGDWQLTDWLIDPDSAVIDSSDEINRNGIFDRTVTKRLHIDRHTDPLVVSTGCRTTSHNHID